MIYLFGWAINYALYFFASLKAFPYKLSAFIALILLGGMVFFRGSVGTDTSAYEMYAQQMLDDSSLILNIEVGFKYLLFFLTNLTGSPLFAVRCVGACFVVLLMLFANRANKIELFFLMIVFIPLFFFSFGMNTLRFGLAACFLLLFFQRVRMSLYKAAIVYAVLSILMHNTALFVVGFWFLLYFNLFSKRNAKYALLLIMSIMFFIYIRQDWILEKVVLYFESGYQSPSKFSGLSTIAGIFLLLAGIYFSKLENKNKFRLFFTTLFMAIVLFWVTQVSYSGLRLLNLLFFASIFSFMELLSKSNKNLTKTTVCFLFLMGVISAGFNYRNMLDTVGTETAFIPYVFYWQEK